MGARAMASGRRPSTLMMSTRRATGCGVGVMVVSVSVGKGVSVVVGGGSVGVDATGRNGVAVGGGTRVAVDVGTAGVALGRQAVSNSAATISKWNSLKRGRVSIRVNLSRHILR